LTPVRCSTATHAPLPRAGQGGRPPMSDFTNIGRRSGPILWSDRLAAIGALESPTNHAPIGMALGCSRDAEGCALYRLAVHGAELAGHWIVIDRMFHPAPASAPWKPSGRGPR